MKIRLKTTKEEGRNDRLGEGRAKKPARGVKMFQGGKRRREKEGGRGKFKERGSQQSVAMRLEVTVMGKRGATLKIRAER